MKVTVGEVRKYIFDGLVETMYGLPNEKKEPFTSKFRNLNSQIATDNRMSVEKIRGLLDGTLLSDEANGMFMELRDIKEQVLPSTRM